MLEYFYSSPTRLRQLRNGPLADCLDEMAGELREKGYAKTCVCGIITMIGKFNDFIRLIGVSQIDKINEDLINRFLNEELPAQGTYKDAHNSMEHLKRFLYEKGFMDKPIEEVLKSKNDEIVEAFDRHLREIRGLMKSTRSGYARSAYLFLNWFDKKCKARQLESISGIDILNYINEHVNLHEGGSWKQSLCTNTRVFLRFLHWNQITATDLSRIVPKVPKYKLSDIPRHLEWKQVRTLIDNISTNHPEGIRDKAVLLLISTLGLRRCEISNMELDWIDWQKGEIRIPKSKTRKERILPLPQELGEALADYVIHARPMLNTRQIFLQHRAPQKELNSASVSSIVRKHLKKSGIECSSMGAYLLRHSLATHMVNQGVPIKEISDVLGHKSIDTTAIYTKVDRSLLINAALPLPIGGE